MASLSHNASPIMRIKARMKRRCEDEQEESEEESSEEEDDSEEDESCDGDDEVSDEETMSRRTTPVSKRKRKSSRSFGTPVKKKPRVSAPDEDRGSNSTAGKAKVVEVIDLTLDDSSDDEKDRCQTAEKPTLAAVQVEEPTTVPELDQEAEMHVDKDRAEPEAKKMVFKPHHIPRRKAAPPSPMLQPISRSGRQSPPIFTNPWVESNAPLPRLPVQPMMGPADDVPPEVDDSRGTGKGGDESLRDGDGGQALESDFDELMYPPTPAIGVAPALALSAGPSTADTLVTDTVMGASRQSVDGGNTSKSNDNVASSSPVVHLKTDEDEVGGASGLGSGLADGDPYAIEEVAERFLERYIMLFDVDRDMLKDAYSDSALFSCSTVGCQSSAGSSESRISTAVSRALSMNPKISQGPQAIVHALKQLGHFQFYPHKDFSVYYDLAPLAPLDGLGSAHAQKGAAKTTGVEISVSPQDSGRCLLSVHAQLYNALNPMDVEDRLAVDQSFLLGRRSGGLGSAKSVTDNGLAGTGSSVDGADGTIGSWPLTILSHQMTLRRTPLLSEEKLMELLPWAQDILQ
ncbi:hypothetical protein CVT24_012119 [Panaeolus cyanescens]|uniref:NTF2 domain-containing protein n=1 Tax=Panaeolus cyanescens TaxID=181874 RepID=A0A409VHI7_9AGAR|nr:hypothetical protein CVT24_012119 [Panaeolus cyanescens]